MNVYTCNDHEGHWPVGACSMIVAEDEKQARRLLLQELLEHGIQQGEKPFTLRKMNVVSPRAYVLLEGEY